MTLEATLEATADIGKANGLEIAASILRSISKDRKQVSVSELKAVALSLEDAVAKLRQRADAVVSGGND